VSKGDTPIRATRRTARFVIFHKAMFQQTNSIVRNI